MMSRNKTIGMTDQKWFMLLLFFGGRGVAVLVLNLSFKLGDVQSKIVLILMF